MRTTEIDTADRNATAHSSSGTSIEPKVAEVFLALLPFLSFLAQEAFSRKAGTQLIMHRHLTVMVVDWVFVPFNYCVVRTIDWSRGTRMLLIWSVSVVVNLITIAVWQHTGADFGHMIDARGVVLAAGWVHLAFAIIETSLLMMFVFCRNSSAPVRLTTIFACVYFLTMLACGVFMHRGFIASDLCASGLGLFFVLFYPRITAKQPM